MLHVHFGVLFAPSSNGTHWTECAWIGLEFIWSVPLRVFKIPEKFHWMWCSIKVWMSFSERCWQRSVHMDANKQTNHPSDKWMNERTNEQTSHSGRARQCIDTWNYKFSTIKLECKFTHWICVCVHMYACVSVSVCVCVLFIICFSCVNVSLVQCTIPVANNAIVIGWCTPVRTQWKSILFTFLKSSNGCLSIY